MKEKLIKGPLICKFYYYYVTSINHVISTNTTLNTNDSIDQGAANEIVARYPESGTDQPSPESGMFCATDICE